MIEIVDRVLTFLSFPEELAVRSAQTRTWQRPRLDPKLMRTVQRWRVARVCGRKRYRLTPPAEGYAERAGREGGAPPVAPGRGHALPRSSSA